MLHEQIKVLLNEVNINNLNVNNILLFLLKHKESLEIHVDLSDEEHMFLIKNRIVNKNYITGEMEILIPFYQHEEGVIFESNINNIRRFVIDNINSYRELFVGVRMGSIGNKRTCIDNMIKFMLYHPDIKYEDIIASTKYYISNTEDSFIMNADNFIYKDEYSKLLTIIEEIELGGFRKSNLL